jgi:hypothetical protein
MGLHPSALLTEFVELLVFHLYFPVNLGPLVRPVTGLVRLRRRYSTDASLSAAALPQDEQ